MPAALKTLTDQLTAVYRKMSGRARILCAVLLLLTLGGMGLLIGTDRTEYATLFSGVSPEDAARITEQLRKNRVLFRLEAGGTSIRVPAKVVHEQRIALAGQGLPRGGGVGFEIFDTQKFGISDFAQQINYRRALQGELERTISQLEAVQSARVHIALPGQELFARENRPVSASVTVKLHPGRTLSKSTVASIVHLVSSSVTGLAADAVAVVDTAGALLHGGPRDGLLGSGGPLEYKQSLENTLARRVGDILDAALGQGHAVVKVTAEVGLSQVERTEEQLDPEKSAVRSESQLEEHDGASGQVASGIPGVRGNLPGGPAAQGGATKNALLRKQSTRNYEVTRTVQRRVSPAGELRRLSVAVLVDSRALAANGKSATTGAVKRRLDLGELEQVVRQAVGFSAARDDVVTVRAVPFAEVEVKAVTPPPNKLSQLMNERPRWLWMAAAGVGVFLVLMLVLALARRRRPRLELIQLPRTVKELQDQEDGAAVGETAGQTGAPALPAGQSDPPRALAQLAADYDAGRAAQVLRAWLAEG